MKRACSPNIDSNNSFVFGEVSNPDAHLIQPPMQGDNVQEQTPPVAPPVAPLVAPPLPPAAVKVLVPELPLPFIVKKESGELANKEPKPRGKLFQSRKKSSKRIRDMKLRLNRKLRQTMTPKNALMALNEVKGITIGDIIIERHPDGEFTAVVTVNSSLYEGKGPTKVSAKNAACEKAWRDFVIRKMTPKSSKVQPGAESMETNEDEAEATEDEMPMLSLASFAIFKLFEEWKRDGSIVPEMRPSANVAQPDGGEDAPVVPKEPKKPTLRTILPTGWETMHPASILCEMRPGLKYIDHGYTIEMPNVVHHFGVVVDDMEFSASGRSKKQARRNVAVKVCNTLFGTIFALDDTS
ncbi:double-stranded RNA-specific editase 1-like [Drosophila elegans]|uniref:double-stranded RNA-specific editase 1-like n=1 Tax=Drosophila elegans TaxID=30023 RepID=UPI0007E77C32|nr:double-stranded RNA-specific editase 1-like [Drosophila elegans]